MAATARNSQRRPREIFAGGFLDEELFSSEERARFLKCLLGFNSFNDCKKRRQEQQKPACAPLYFGLAEMSRGGRSSECRRVVGPIFSTGWESKKWQRAGCLSYV
jgi:hypothetical protein